MSPERRQALSLHRLLAVVATFVLLGSQALSAIHYVFVPHHVCALHGVLEDGERAAGSTVLSSPQRSSGVAAIPSRDSGHGHEACILAARSEHGISAPDPAVHGVETPSAVAPSTTEGIDVPVDRAVLLARAPKLSPPSV